MSITYHNPEGLSDWGQSDGWRLLTTEEIKQPLPDDAEFIDGVFWLPVTADATTFHWTYRTKKPLPVSPLVAQLDAEIKAKQELKDIALAVEAGAEWEARSDDSFGPFLDWGEPRYPLEWYFSPERGYNWQVRLKPRPVTRPWSKGAEVPDPCWLRGPKLTGECLVTRVVGDIIYTSDGAGYDLSKAGVAGFHQIADHEYTTNRSIKDSWKPCETTEEAK